jgi:hypothetical protein
MDATQVPGPSPEPSLKNPAQEKSSGAVEKSGDDDRRSVHPAWDSAARTFPWMLLAVVLLFFHKELKSLVQDIDERIRLGAPIKVKDFELGTIKIEQGEQPSAVLGTRRDDGTREAERNKYYAEHRQVMLVHTLARSHGKNGWYDIRIFVVPHNRIEDGPNSLNNLAQVTRVEYYLGGAWNQQVFPTQDRASGFAISVSAYGPFLATAKVFFSDGQSAMLDRYIDFEMGNYAPVNETASTSKVQ